MRTISTWGKHHPVAARLIIIFSHLLLLLLAIFLGTWIQQAGWQIPPVIVLIACGAFAWAFFTYPARLHGQKPPGYYAQQKLRDFVLASTAFVALVSMVHDRPSTGIAGIFNEAYAATTTREDGKKKIPTADEILASLEYRDKKSLTRQEKRILRKEFKKQLGVFAIATIKNDRVAKQSAGLKILAIVGAIGLLILVAGLSCNLSCSGMDGAAIIVGVFGTAAVIVGLVLVLKSINRKQKEKIKQKESEAGPI
jgi:hypothetical protein